MKAAHTTLSPSLSPPSPSSSPTNAEHFTDTAAGTGAGTGAGSGAPVVPLLQGLHITAPGAGACILSTDTAAPDTDNDAAPIPAPSPASTAPGIKAVSINSRCGSIGSSSSSSANSGAIISGTSTITIRLLSGKTFFLHFVHTPTPTAPVLMCEVVQQLEEVIGCMLPVSIKFLRRGLVVNTYEEVRDKDVLCAVEHFIG